MERISTLDALETALARSRLLVYKHSTACGLSDRARIQVERFAENFPDAPVFLIDVLADRFLSDELERRLGVRHETPQVILVDAERPPRDASHHEIRAELLGRWWTGASGGI